MGLERLAQRGEVAPAELVGGVAAGATTEQLDDWDTLLDTPGQWFPSIAMVAAWGRRR